MKMVDRIQRFVNAGVANAGEQVEEWGMEVKEGNRSCPLPSSSWRSAGKEIPWKADNWDAGISSS